MFFSVLTSITPSVQLRQLHYDFLYYDKRILVNMCCIFRNITDITLDLEKVAITKITSLKTTDCS